MRSFTQSHSIYFFMIQNRTYQFFKPPQYTDEIIAKNWNPRLSAKENFKRIGLSSGTTLNSTTKDSASNPSKAIELFDIPDSDKMNPSQKMLPVSTENQKYMVPLLEKYGNDYKKMSRDMKMNPMQHTETQLRKIGSRFLLLEEKQLRVDVPEKVKELMQCF